jgi:hypothetical protein
LLHCYSRWLERKFLSWSKISMFSHVIIQKYVWELSKLEDWLSQKGSRERFQNWQFLLSPQKFQWSRAFKEFVLQVFMNKVKVFEKKVKSQKVKVMVSNKRSCQNEYTCDIWKPCTYQSKVMTKVKVLEKVNLQSQRSEDQGHGIKWKALP